MTREDDATPMSPATIVDEVSVEGRERVVRDDE